MTSTFIVFLLICLAIGADVGARGGAWSLLLFSIAAVVALQIGFVASAVLENH